MLMPNIKEIKAKYKETPNDSTLARNLELMVNLKFIPEKQLCGQSIILEDESGTLEAVAKANIFDNDHFKMANTNFLPSEFLSYPLTSQLLEMHAANSLHITADDYARFVAGLMNEETEMLKNIFTPQVTMENDTWAIERGLSDEDRKKLMKIYKRNLE